MITRREAFVGMAGALLLSERALSAEKSVVMEALAGKAPLIKQTYRPQNYETPLVDLRSELTANDKFFVRYHLANIPEVDARTWRLRVGGDSAGKAREWSLDELRR